jgi:hypothetical protein
MNKVVYIYSLKDPRDYQIKYIGKTIDIERRRKEHNQIHRNKKSKKNSWIIHLIENGMQPIMEILEECEEPNWIEREMYWIQYYKELGFDLKNMTLGGESNGRQLCAALCCACGKVAYRCCYALARFN